MEGRKRGGMEYREGSKGWRKEIMKKLRMEEGKREKEESSM